FGGMGIPDVHQEAFQFPQHRVAAEKSVFSFSGTTYAFDVFEGSGSGVVDDAPLTFVGTAKPEELAGVDLHGRIALVKRDPSYHRSSQYRNVADAGAVAMLYVSQASQNQIQIGSVRKAWEALGPIPTITIGADDGAVIQAAVEASQKDPSA